METSKILNADILDIIFEGRNQQYGAYDLRKTYNRRLARAVSVTFGVCLLAVAGGVLANNSSAKKPPMDVSGVITLAPVPDAPSPVIPPPPKVQPKIEIIVFTPPKIVTDVVTPPPAAANLEDVQVGVVAQTGTRGDIVNAPVEPVGTAKIEAPVKAADYDDMPAIVQVQAQFPGGLDAWKKFLERNLRQDVPVDNGAPSGNYKVLVSFVVDREGNITDIKAENDPGYGIAAEAIRVIQRSGKWIPAMQNNNRVKYRQVQPVTFQVNDQQ